LSAHLDLLERQGFVTVIAGIALPNEASVVLHEKLGFVLSGIERGVGFKRGEWVDVGRWQKDLAPRTTAPDEPRPYFGL
jgi:phosphinothricin acetyltransferase